MSDNVLNHLAIILDGNGRWAKENGHTRNYGHKKGCDNLVKLVKHVRAKNIKYFTVFAFSTENWNRPKEEVDYLMSLIDIYINKYKNNLTDNNVKVNIIGSRNNLSNKLLDIINEIETKTKNNNGLVFNICFNYGAIDEIVNACKGICKDALDKKINIDSIDNMLFENYLYTKDSPSVDLLIRTSGEMRISNFLLYKIAYSELYFTKCNFPDFNEDRLDEAIKEYYSRHRRYGGIK